MGSWKVILPVWGRNHVYNPIASGAGYYFTAHAGSTVTVETTYSYLGYQCYRVQTTGDSDGIYLETSTLANAIHYATYRVIGTAPAWKVSLDGSNWFTPVLLFREGSWYVYGYQFTAVRSSGCTKLYICQSGAGTGDYYIGHAQVEQSTYYTTPITGSSKGFCSDGYSWLEAPHGSPSDRLNFERSGGREVDLEDTYKFRVLYGIGTGMPPIQHHISEMALLPGALYQGHKVLPRIIDLVSATIGKTPSEVALARSGFIEAIKPDAVAPEQPVVFRYYGINPNRPVEFYAYYDSGLEFQTSSGIIDKPTPRFICYDPFIYETHTESKVLERQVTITNANYIVKKKDGIWSNISSAFNARVMSIVQGNNGYIFIGGDFTDVGGANGDYIVRLNPYSGAISALGTGTNGHVISLKKASNGDIYAAGEFTSAGGVASTKGLACWDISTGTWVSVGGGLNATGPCYGYCEAFDGAGNLYIGGNFTDMFDANGDYITKWNGSAFSSLGTGLNGLCIDLAVAPDGSLYATGVFTQAGGVTVNYVAKWDGTTWSALGTGLSGGSPSTEGASIAIDSAGNVYVGGNFTSAGGVSCNNIARWNGQGWEALGGGLTGTSSQCAMLAFDKDDNLYAGGDFTAADGMAINDRNAVWNGSIWYGLDINLPGTPIVHAVLPVGNDVYIGYGTAGDAIASYTNNILVPNTGSHGVYPVIKFKRDEGGTGVVLKWLRNETTRALLLLNYLLLPGETLTIDLTPGAKAIYSDFNGPVWKAVLRTSDLASFNLLGGTNVVTLFGFGTATVTPWMEWKVTHWAADTAVT